MSESIVDRARRDAEVRAIVSPDSHQVKDILEEVKGKSFAVSVFGEKGKRGATRTEIVTKQGVVEVHKNFTSEGGLPASTPRFSSVEVKPKGQKPTARLDIKLEGTSPFNPVYAFYEGEERIGIGYGQEMNMRLASNLVGKDVGGLMDHLNGSVLDWIKEKLGGEKT